MNLKLCGCRQYDLSAMPQRFVSFSAPPQAMQQHGELSCGRNHRSFLSIFSATLGQLQTPAPQIAVRSKRPQYVVRKKPFRYSISSSRHPRDDRRFSKQSDRSYWGSIFKGSAKGLLQTNDGLSATSVEQIRRRLRSVPGASRSTRRRQQSTSSCRQASTR